MHHQIQQSQSRDLATRVTELERDVLRLVDFSVDLQRQLETEKEYLRKVVRLLRRHVGDTGED